MPTIEKHLQKQFMSKLILLIILFFLILYFIFSFGFRLILNFSAFISDLSSKKQTSQITKSENFYGSIDIDSIPVATNSPKIIVTGSVINLSTVEFYLNSKKVKEINMNFSDYFSEEIGDLVKGNNKVYVIGRLKDSEDSKRSNEFNVFYKPDKPKLEIKEPQDKSTTSKQEIKIKGLTDKETFIKINDLPAVVDANGNFEYLVRLKEGENVFLISAEDIAGNIETITLSVTYQKED